MAKYTNQEVINKFFQGWNDIESHTGNLWVTIDGKRLMNYSTCLVERHEEYGLIVNRTSYSVTTSKIQGYIMSELWSQYSPSFIQEHVIQVEDVQQGTSYLEEYAKKRIEWMKGIKQVKVINYFDVWGNKKDGWEINNMCEEYSDELIQLHEHATSKEAFQLLKSVGFLSSTTRINQVDIEDLHDFGFEFHQRKDGKPICRIEFIN
jgi:hypothetical protein